MWAQKLYKLDDSKKFPMLRKEEQGSKVKKYANKTEIKVQKQVRDQKVWKQVKDGVQGFLYVHMQNEN